MSGALIMLLCSFGDAQQGTAMGTVSLDSIIHSVELAQLVEHRQVSYQIIREYRLFGSKDSKTDSDVVAEINFRAPASKDYSIQSSSGSNRGTQLVKRVLDHEVEAASKDDRARRFISRDNYNFDYLGEAMLDGQPCYLLRLRPKRTESDLIAGQVWVDAHSFRIRQIEGNVMKTPSWWLKTVHIKLMFADLEGTWMQTSMQATAEVRLLGPHTLTSQILDYRRASEVAATRTAFRPSLQNR